MVELPFTNSDEFLEEQIKAFGVKSQVANGGAWGCVDADCSRVTGMVAIESDALWLQKSMGGRGGGRLACGMLTLGRD